MNIIACFTCDDDVVEFKSRRFRQILYESFLHPRRSQVVLVKQSFSLTVYSHQDQRL